jgi:hypothetical protein
MNALDVPSSFGEGFIGIEVRGVSATNFLDLLPIIPLDQEEMRRSLSPFFILDCFS